MGVPVFYSFHYANDVMRVQLIRNIGALEDNTPVAPNTWEDLKKQGDAAVEKWIEENMKYRRCAVVLVGSETANRRWVQHEIRRAWDTGKGVVGIYIHNINCPRNGTCSQGPNPFDQITMSDGRRLSAYAHCHDPGSYNAYGTIKANMERWVDEAIAARKT